MSVHTDQHQTAEVLQNKQIISINQLFPLKCLIFKLAILKNNISSLPTFILYQPKALLNRQLLWALFIQRSLDWNKAPNYTLLALRSDNQTGPRLKLKLLYRCTVVLLKTIRLGPYPPPLPFLHMRDEISLQLKLGKKELIPIASCRPRMSS